MRGILAAFASLSVVTAFSFSFSNVSPRSCETIVVEWRGGKAPFSLTLMPVYDYPLNVSLPASAWNEANQTGRYEWKVNYPSGKRLSAIMSDATGLATGGVSPLVTVGAAAQGETCDVRAETTDFYFYLNQTSVTQCAPVEIYWDTSATQPVTFIGAIPGGQAFQLNGEQGNRLDWTVNIPSGTQFLIAAFDAGQYGTGGSSDLLTVGPADDTSCLDAFSPSSTIAGHASSTGDSAPVRTVTQTRSAGDASSGRGLSGGAIAGIVIGALAGVILLQFLLFWFCCRKPLAAYRQQRHDERMHPRQHPSTGNVDLISSDGSTAFANSSRASRLMDLDMADTASHVSMEERRGWTNYEPSPFPHTASPPALPSPTETQSLPSPVIGHSRRQSVQSQSRYSKAQMALQNPDDEETDETETRPLPPAGFRRHEDAGGVEQPAVELPPLYSSQWAAERQRQ